MGFVPKNAVYYIKQQHFVDEKTSLKALNAQCKMLKDIGKDYPIEFLMGLSNHDGKYVEKINANEGVLRGNKVAFREKDGSQGRGVTGWHIHIYIYGYYAATVANEFAKRQNVLYHRQPHDKYVEHCAFMTATNNNEFIPYDYVERQSTYMRYSDRQKVLERVDSLKAIAAERRNSSKAQRYGKDEDRNTDSFDLPERETHVRSTKVQESKWSFESWSQGLKFTLPSENEGSKARQIKEF